MKNTKNFLTIILSVFILYSCSKNDIAQETNEDELSEIHSHILDVFGLEKIKTIEWEGKSYSLDKNDFSKEELPIIKRALDPSNSAYIDSDNGIISLSKNKEDITNKADLEYQQHLLNDDDTNKRSKGPFAVGIDLNRTNGQVHIFKASRYGWVNGSYGVIGYTKRFKIGGYYRNNIASFDIFSWPLSSHRNYNIRTTADIHGQPRVDRLLSKFKRWNGEYFTVHINSKNRRNIKAIAVTLRKR